MKYDFFVSHASEDKDVVVRPLVALLKDRGFRVWYDEDVLRLGDSLSASIDRGLSESRFGLVVLSPMFFAKHWTRRELQGLITLDEQERSKILPIWHNVTKRDVAEFSPPLADVIAVTTDKGLHHVVEAIAQSVQLSGDRNLPDHGVTSVPHILRKSKASGTTGGLVIFVHGLSASAPGDMGLLLEEHLRSNPDWEAALFRYNAGPSLGSTDSIDKLGQRLASFAEECLNRRSGKLILVAHSVGGLIAMDAILKSALLRESLTTLFMIAVPTSGLRYTSLLGFFSQRLRDISAGSPKIIELNNRWTAMFGNAPPFQIESIVGDMDSVVPSSSSSRLPGARLRIVSASHTDVYRTGTVRDLLDQAMKR